MIRTYVRYDSHRISHYLVTGHVYYNRRTDHRRFDMATRKTKTQQANSESERPNPLGRLGMSGYIKTIPVPSPNTSPGTADKSKK